MMQARRQSVLRGRSSLAATQVVDPDVALLFCIPHANKACRTDFVGLPSSREEGVGRSLALHSERANDPQFRITQLVFMVFERSVHIVK